MKKTERPWALVTGACGGIGRAIVAEFVDEGYQVIATDIYTTSDLSQNEHVEYLPLDLVELQAGSGQREKFLDEVRSHTKDMGLKALVNNAALQILGSTKEVSLEDWQSTLNVNLSAPFILIQSFIDDLITAGGSVVNIASVHSKATKPGFVAYATSKAALAGLTRALAVDLGGGIRINSINPAATNTKMLLDGFIGREALYSELGKVHPIERIASPTEIARVVVFLVSDEANFMTGCAIDVDGGVLSRLHDLN